MRILFIGDIYGESGRNAIKNYLPNLITNKKIDFVIANGENATHGRGLSLAHYNELINQGIDVITLGNHFFSRKEGSAYFNEATRLIRPYNLPDNIYGVGTRLFTVNNKQIRVTAILGKVMMKDNGQLNIYQSVDKLLDNNNEDIHIIDFHGEVTSEKMTFAYNYADKLTAVLGTHTHVQTADETIISNHCAYISDVGMTGPSKSIIGADVSSTIERAKNGNGFLQVSLNPGKLNGVIIDIDENNNATKIERINIEP